MESCEVAARNRGPLGVLSIATIFLCQIPRPHSRGKLSFGVRPKERERVGKYQWLCAVILFGMVYFVVSVGFPNLSVANQTHFLWRLAAWLIFALAFAIHIGFEHFRLRNSPSQDSNSRRCGDCTWGICSCCRSEYSRTNGRNRQPRLARLVARDLADHGRAAGVCGRLGCNCWACPSTIERQAKPFLILWPNVEAAISQLALMACTYQLPLQLSTISA